MGRRNEGKWRERKNFSEDTGMRKQQVFPHSVTSIPILAKAKSYTLIVQVEITDKQGINRKDNILRNKRFLLLTLKLRKNKKHFQLNETSNERRQRTGTSRTIN